MGNVVDGKMKLNEIGKMIFEEWLSTAQKRGNVKLHEFVIMPDHLHGLIEITHSVENVVKHEKFYCPKHTIGSIVRGFKSSTTTQLYNYISSHELHWRRGELIFAPNTTGMEFVPNESRMKSALHDSEMKSAFHDSEMNSVLNNSEHKSTSDELEKTCAPFKLWQRGYYDRFIRTQDELNAIKNYIKLNPSRWTSRMNENSL
jgi:REP element-mobilizing transposase RayT